MYTTGEALTLEQVQEMVILQDKLNCIINPNWIEKNLDYYLAIQMETAEAIEHLGWKWWKKQEPNMSQVRLEIVDIWHFVLCQYISDYGIERAPYELKRDVDKGSVNNYYNSWTLREVLVDAMREAALLDVMEIAGAYGHILLKAGMTWDTLYRQYMLKNTLNIFRQNNGYKIGTYHKIWEGVEDNEYLMKIPYECETYLDIYTKLEDLYSIYGDNA